MFPAASTLNRFAPRVHPLVEPDVVADDAGFADHHARAVVDAEEVADLGSGVDVDSGFGVGHLGDQPRKDRHAELQQGVGKAVVGIAVRAG